MPAIERAPALAALLIFLTPAARGDEPSAATREELVSLTRQLMDAIAPGKAEVWQRLLAEDAIIVDEFGRKEDKRGLVAALRPLPPGLSGSIEVRNPIVRQHGDAAVVHFEAYERESVFGQALVIRYLSMATWVRRAAGWQLVAMQSLTLPTEPPALTVPGLRLDDYAGRYRFGPGREWIVRRSGEGLTLATRAGGKEIALQPLAADVFTEGNEERNLVIFRRDGSGRVERLIERRKYNDLHMERVGG